MHKGGILPSIRDNRDVIDMDNHLPIKLILYWTPLYKHKLIQRAVGDMLEIGIIEHST